MVTKFKDRCNLAFVEEDGDIYSWENNFFKEMKADQVELDVEDYI